MTVEALGLQQDTTNTSAEILRRAISAAYQRGATIGSEVGGLVGATDCQVVPAGSGLKVEVEPGELWVPGSSVVTQGLYYTRVTVKEVLTPAAASANGRIDRIVMEVIDEAYVGGSTNEAKLVVVKGAPNAGCTAVSQYATYAPGAPTSSYTLGYVFIPTSGAVVSGDILNVSLPVSGNVGAWTPLTLPAAVEVASVGKTPEWRYEGGVVRLKGQAKLKSGKTLAAGESFASGGWVNAVANTQTFVASASPTPYSTQVGCTISTSTSTEEQMLVGGSNLKINLFAGGTIPELLVINLDGISFPIR